MHVNSHTHVAKPRLLPRCTPGLVRVGLKETINETEGDAFGIK